MYWTQIVAGVEKAQRKINPGFQFKSRAALEQKVRFCVIPIPSAIKAQAKKNKSLEEFDVKHLKAEMSKKVAVHIGDEDDDEMDEEEESVAADQHGVDIEFMTDQELRSIAKRRLMACSNDADHV